MKKILSLAIIILFFFLALFSVQNLLVPKYMEDAREGVLTAEYYADAHRNDVLIIGDCEVYENISPVTLWEEYGIPSFIRGNAQQLLWHSFAMLEDALRYETPKVVVLSVLAMMYNEPQKETYNRMALDGLRWSRAKYGAIRASVLPEESVASYFLPLLRFHDRWNELGRADWQYYFQKRQVGIAGFVMRSDVLSVPAGWEPTPKLLPSYDFGPNAWAYLDKITALCGEKGIQLVLFKAPSLTPYWYPQWDVQIADYAREHGLSYLNALAKTGEIGLDYTLDTYDMGLHLNRQGAEKMARYLGGYLMENCPSLTDRRGDAALDRDWAVKAAQYRAMQAAQEKEIAAGGEVETFFVPEKY
ncbi:MAG: SGNH/GDSL hydrolase family protein [Oscillospiraceae bacterium]|nr:SGNH/GDSL hydrolase family protein [Oscillospiraceae bacterium]